CGSLIPTPANEYRINPEQSNPTVPAPSSMPRLGPAAVPPPHEYGTPICDMPRRITYSEACRPYTRGICPLVKPVSVGLRMANCCRNCLPMFAVTCDEVAEMPSTELMIAIGSPLTKALGTMGKVGSQTEASHLPVLPCPAAELAPGASQRSTGAPGVGTCAADVDHVARAASSLAFAASR